MRVLKKVVHEREKRLLFKKQELDFFLLKFLLLNTVNSKDVTRSFFRRKASFFLNGLSKKGSRPFLRNRCLITGRSRNTNKIFGLSRLKLRESFKYGEIFSLRKATW